MACSGKVLGAVVKVQLGVACSGKVLGAVVKVTELVKTEKWNTNRHGLIYRQTDRHRQMDGRTDGQKDGQTNGWTDRQTDG